MRLVHRCSAPFLLHSAMPCLAIETSHATHCKRAVERNAVLYRACAGIVQGKATVRSVRRQGDFATLAISFPPGSADGIQIGASVAINGTCLTVRFAPDIAGSPALLASATLQARCVNDHQSNSPCQCVAASVSHAVICACQVTTIGQSKDPTRPLLSFDVISETLRATNLGGLEMNSAVNFERCVV